MKTSQFIDAVKLFYQYADNYLKDGENFRFVGGCVRDYIIKAPEINDIDIVATDAKNLYNAIVDAARKDDKYVVEYMFCLYSNTYLIKIYDYNNTFRYDYEISNVKGSTWEEDAQKRDFTINALYIKLVNDEIIISDPLHYGLYDLKNNILRVCNGIQTFIDDPIRLFRLIRFVGKEFNLDNDILTFLELFLNPVDANIANVPTLNTLCSFCYPEAIKYEIDKAFKSDNIKDAISFAIKFHLFDYLTSSFGKMEILHQKNAYHNETLLVHTIDVMQYVHNNMNKNNIYFIPTMWAALLHDIGKVNTLTTDEDGTTHFYGHEIESEKIFQQIKYIGFSEFEASCISFMILHHMETKCYVDNVFSIKRRKSIRRMMFQSQSKELFDALMILCDADISAMHNKDNVEDIEWIRNLHNMINCIEKEEPCFYNIKLPISRDEIQNAVNCKDVMVDKYIEYLNKLTIGNPTQTDSIDKCVKLIQGAKIY
ncbi:HD domain-containing protein [uncultured Methanobrevibacter sp.]|uniref:HD domain-containing protein n=1 Tax=uncultured Methanobrevibacter sp. TaxID=253161 RepID=UPI0025DC7C7B|nr:HD domain-containing protein [uncultured Methanobrevibacter sp.]